MKNLHDKFKRDLMKVDATLRRYRIAYLEDHVHPEFDNPRINAEATFRALNPAIFEEIIDHIREIANKYESKINTKVLIDEKTKQYQLILIPQKTLSIEDQKKEIESYLSHMAPAIRDYEMKFKE